jgi:hypothetical protein
MLWPLAALACIGGIFLCYHVWLIATDNIGTFHNVAKSADLDSDGDLDVVLNNVRQESEFTAFRRSSQRLRYSKKHGLTVGDFNADGYADVFAGAYSSDYRVWYNQGDGTFRTDVGSLRTEEGRPGGG